MSEVRVRFAPSPTGFLHIGGLRTALYNYLYAKKEGGSFILRIEDTDRTRIVEGAIEVLLNNLEWAGLSHNEGVFLDKDGSIYEKGDFGPYVQSDRVEADVYQKYADQLIEEGKAYYCFCSSERLEEVRNQQKADGLIPRYDGFCRGLSLEEARARVEAGEKYVVRMKLPQDTDVEFVDQVKGKISINTEDMDDQVLIKSDGFPTYHFAVVVDDHLMGITHIVRGDEWIPSTPKHVLLYDFFGWDKPEFIHLPTVLNKNRKKLSKRNDDVAVADFIDQGYMPEALINYLALVGWSPEDNQEIFSLEELVDAFSFDRVSKTGGIFDRDKLDWVNSQHIRKMSTEEFADTIEPILKEAGYIDDTYPRDKLELLASTFQESVNIAKEITEVTEFIFAKDLEVTEEEAKLELEKDHVPSLAAAFLEELEAVDEVDQDFASGVMKSIQKKTGIKGKDLWMPTRAMISGNVHGPELNNIMVLLGKEELEKRLKTYL